MKTNNIFEIQKILDRIILFNKFYREIHPNTHKEHKLYEVLNSLEKNTKKQYKQMGLSRKKLNELKKYQNQLSTMVWMKELMLDILNNNEIFNPLKFTEEDVKNHKEVLNYLDNEIWILDNTIKNNINELKNKQHE